VIDPALLGLPPVNVRWPVTRLWTPVPPVKLVVPLNVTLPFVCMVARPTLVPDKSSTGNVTGQQTFAGRTLLLSG